MADKVRINPVLVAALEHYAEGRYNPCVTGPCWADVDLRPIAAAPTQRGLFA